MGVILQGGLKIEHHVTETANKAKWLFHALAQLGGQGWGYQAVNYIVLYKVLFHMQHMARQEDSGNITRDSC